jgi:hypothetical protein
MINAILALVNLIPIPPLDGSKIWPCLIPGMRPVVKGRMSQVSLVILVVAMYTGTIRKILDPGMTFLASVMYSAMDDTETYTERPDSFSPSLVAPDQAYAVTYRIAPARDNRPQGYALSYQNDQPYPCNDLIADIAESLASQGWHKTTYVLFEPSELSLDEWAPVDTQDASWIEWTGTWFNESDEWILLHVSYERNAEAQALSTARIQMVQNTSELVELYKAFHPDETSE